MLDAVGPESLYGMFDLVMEKLIEQGTLEEFRSIGGNRSTAVEHCALIRVDIPTQRFRSPLGVLGFHLHRGKGVQSSRTNSP